MQPELQHDRKVPLIMKHNLHHHGGGHFYRVQLSSIAVVFHAPSFLFLRAYLHRTSSASLRERKETPVLEQRKRSNTFSLHKVCISKLICSLQKRDLREKKRIVSIYSHINPNDSQRQHYSRLHFFKPIFFASKFLFFI
jgi:hypothetical protein